MTEAMANLGQATSTSQLILEHCTWTLMLYQGKSKYYKRVMSSTRLVTQRSYFHNRFPHPMSHTLYSPEVNNGAVTSFIPLTTTWTASKGCSSSFRLNGPSLVAFDPGYGLDVDSNVVCAPPAVTKWWEHGHLDDNDGSEAKVSIGPLTCPYGFYTVASSTKDATSTLAMCCPEYDPQHIDGFLSNRRRVGITIFKMDPLARSKESVCPTFLPG